jgi:hypothetical protein
MQDMSPGATGDIFRRALRLGHVEGGEYRDPKFLPELAGRKFDDIAATCCSVVAVPPLSGGFIVYGTNGVHAEMIRAFLANGNAMVIAGGVVSLEFINRMFYSQLEPADGNYDEGPFRKSSSVFGPWQKLPFDSLGQIGTDVYAVKPSSLPEGSTVLFESPDSVGAFIMPFCQRLNPQYAIPVMFALPIINIVYELVLFIRCADMATPRRSSFHPRAASRSKPPARGSVHAERSPTLATIFMTTQSPLLRTTPSTASLVPLVFVGHAVHRWIDTLRVSATYFQGYNRY